MCWSQATCSWPLRGRSLPADCELVGSRGYGPVPLAVFDAALDRLPIPQFSVSDACGRPSCMASFLRFRGRAIIRSRSSLAFAINPYQSQLRAARLLRTRRLRRPAAHGGARRRSTGGGPADAGVTGETLRRWVRRADEHAGRAHSHGEQGAESRIEGLVRLRVGNGRLRKTEEGWQLEREILGRATAYFTEETQWGPAAGTSSPLTPRPSASSGYTGSFRVSRSAHQDTAHQDTSPGICTIRCQSVRARGSPRSERLRPEQRWSG